MDDPKSNVIVFPSQAARDAAATAAVRGRIESGQRETFDAAICVRAGSRNEDLLRATGRLVITTFGGVVEDVSFTPQDDEIDDVLIFPVNVARDEERLTLRSKRSWWEFLISR